MFEYRPAYRSVGCRGRQTGILVEWCNDALVSLFYKSSIGKLYFFSFFIKTATSDLTMTLKEPTFGA